MQYAPHCNIGQTHIAHQWTWLKLSKFIRKKLLLEEQTINKLYKNICDFSLHKKDLFAFDDETMYIVIEYISKPKLSFFKITSFMIIFN